ncbi:MAG: hypothetical protein Q8O58_00770 [Gallionella sp.]|nr:hypothetical protein [Gallionella sp.]
MGDFLPDDKSHNRYMTQPPRRNIISPLQRGWVNVRSMQETQRVYIYNELSHARGLIPILMKRRNGEQWSREERELLLRNLRAISNLSPYLVPILMPGGVLMLPLIAWWIDRRRKGRGNTADE